MKKISSILLLGAALASCGAPGNGSYEINGTYADSTLDSTTIFLMKGETPVDSAVMAGKSFAFKGDVDSIATYRLAFKYGSGEKVGYRTMSRVFVEPGTKVNVTFDDFVKVTDNGGVNEVFSKFMEEASKLNEMQMSKYQDLMAAQVDRDSMYKVMDEMRDEAIKIWSEAIKANSNSIVGTAIFADFCPNIDNKAQFDSICATLPHVQLFETILKQKAYFENLEATSEGKLFVDFSGKDLEGKDVKLSDFVGKGKYVLVDFWASWCGPCRGEIPNILKVNEDFGGDNFMVLGVDVWDKLENFKEAVKDEKINYSQIFTEGDAATKLYAINGIPQIMLFAPDGTIVKRGLRGEAIASTVAECLKK